MRSDAIELGKSSFGKTPECFNSAHMILPSSKFIQGMIDSVVIIPIQKKTIIRSPSICVDGRPLKYLSLSDRHQFFSRTILHNTNKYFSISLEYSKDRSFSCCSPSSLPAYSFCSKVTLIYFHFTREVFIRL